MEEERKYWSVECPSGLVSLKLTDEEVEFLRGLGYSVRIPTPMLHGDVGYDMETKRREEEFKKLVEVANE